MENNGLMIFANPEFGNVRIIEEGNKYLFCGTDVAKALGYTNPNKAIRDHCRGRTKRSTPISGKVQEINFISEGDVYRLIVHSRLPGAERFEKWVFDEVLPTIRKHGAYMTPKTIEKVLYNPEFIINLAQKLKSEQERNSVLAKENRELATENNALVGKIQTYDDVKLLNALVRALAGRNYRGDYSFAWNSFYKQLKYKYGYDLKIRRGKSKNKSQALVTYLKDDEVRNAISLAAAMCKEAGLDLNKIINPVNAKLYDDNAQQNVERVLN